MRTDPVTEAYLRACARPGDPLRTAARRLEFEHFYGRTWGARQLARPLFVPQRHLDEAAADLRALHRLVFELPERLYGGDTAALCAELGMSPRATELACRAEAAGRTPLYIRPDLYYDGERFTLLELNSGSEVGGVDSAAVNEAYLALPEFRDFAKEHQLGYADLGERIAGFLRTMAAPVTGGGDPVVALVDISANLDAWREHYEAFAAHMAPRGIEIRVCHIADLGTAADGRLTAGGTPIDVALRYFTLEEMVAEPRCDEWLAPVLRAHEAGRTIFFASFDYGIHANKGLLAILSERRAAGAFTEEESAVIDRLLPWTRRVTPELWEHCRAEREHLLLKPTTGGGGGGITTGWEVTDAEWEAAWGSALRRPFIVQRRAAVRLEPVPDGPDGALTAWLPVYGIFVFDDGYAGTFVRTLPATVGNVVNVNTGAAFTTVFSYEE
ncbi:MAG TPA: glutathionylspermidine synthase family protein [Pseudonocardiaceae bacterium]